MESELCCEWLQLFIIAEHGRMVCLVYSEAVECMTSAESVSVSNPYRCLTWQLFAPKATFFLNALSNSAEKEVYTEKTKQNKTKQNKTKQNKTKQNKTKQNKTKHKQNKQTKKHLFNHCIVGSLQLLVAITCTAFCFCQNTKFFFTLTYSTSFFFSCEVCGLIGATNTIIDILVRSLHKARLLLVSCQHPDGSM